MINGPWAIQPDKLLELQSIYGKHLRGEVTIQPRPQAAQTQNYVNHGGTAIIPVTGILGKNLNILMQIFGGTSTQAIGRQFALALEDSAVEQIMLYVDSPGGTVDGTQALAGQIMAARGTKPVIAYTDGCMCSAAYWIGAAADRVYAGNGTVQIGSIGVVAGHVDVSGRESQLGIKTTEITAGKFKRIASSFAPLSADGRASIQDTVDYLYSIFVSDVALARNTSEQRVLSNMADGRVFIGQQAVNAGLIDGIQTLNNCLKGVARMAPNTVSSQAQSREQLHASVKAYQAQFPGTDYLAALRAVSNTATDPANDDRGDLYVRAKRYQAARPGTDLLTALRAVEPQEA